MAARVASSKVKTNVRGRQASVAQAAKKPRSKKLLVKNEEAFPEFSPQETKVPLVRLRKSYFITLLVLSIIVLIVVGFLSWNRGFFILATVNGAPIDRLTFIRETEKMAGKRTLETLILKTLIEQEAKKKNITVTPEEVDKKLADIEKQYKDQGQDFGAFLQLQGLEKKDYIPFLRLEILLDKLVSKDVKVTDEEVTKYIETNKDSLPQDKDQKQLQKDVYKLLSDQKADEKKQALLTQIKKRAKILNYTPYILPF